jgi:1-acyl-sn-glycerol-3-phosphate acyltransferase
MGAGLCQSAPVKVNAAISMGRWHYEPAADLNLPPMEKLRRFPREPDLTVYALRSAAALVLRGWLRLYHRLEITGREHLPGEESFIMVANHGSHLDALTLLAALPLRKLHRAFPAAAQDYFFVNPPRLAMAAIVVNALPFARQTHIRHSLDLCRGLLANPGNILVLFPEGTRSTSGEVGDFKPGIGLLLAGTKVPVVPCYLAGAFEAWPKSRFFPRPRQLRLRIGALRTYADMAPGKESASRIGEELRAAVLELSRSTRKDNA